MNLGDVSAMSTVRWLAMVTFPPVLCPLLVYLHLSVRHFGVPRYYIF